MATQAERRTATRERLLEAAAVVLVDLGAGGFTTTEVARRSGLSQGAVFKHFPTKGHLLSATVEAIYAGVVARYEGEYVARVAAVGHGPGDLEARLDAGIDLLWEAFQDERLIAAYDLFTTARTDPALQADLQPVVRAHVDSIHALAELLFPDAHAVDPDRLRDAIDLTVAVMEGLVVNRLALPDPDMDERVLAVLRRWNADRLADLVRGAST